MYGSVKKGGMSCTKRGGKKMSVSHKKKSMRKRGGMSCTKKGGKKGGKKGSTMKKRKSQKKSKSFLQRLGF
jgi:hypothetical protein